MTPQDVPRVGMKLKDLHGQLIATVSDVFPAGEYPGMILEWTNENGHRGQAFTTRNWQKRWERAI